jgi:hypothetical protein
MAQCARCNPFNNCTTMGCSNDVAPPETPCCNYCCPQNFTEMWYHDRPSDYPSHPHTFLVQTTTIDENSDTCAARNCEGAASAWSWFSARPCRRVQTLSVQRVRARACARACGCVCAGVGVCVRVFVWSVGGGPADHDTMRRHGGASSLFLIPPHLERCFCVGSPADPAAAASPYTKLPPSPRVV